MPKATKSDLVHQPRLSFGDAVRKGASDFSQRKSYLSMDEIMQTARGSNGQIKDVKNSYWWSPLQPIAPVAPPDQRPRQRAILPGENISWTPGADKLLGFETLRALSDTWDVLRLIIETRKNQLCALDWEIRVKENPHEKIADRKQRQIQDPKVKEIKRFLEKPDGENSFRTWLRLWIEDMLVLDAVALYYERDTAGKIANVIPIDGATVNRMMTDQGLTPQPPDVAYQQVLYGAPAFNLTTDDLFYFMQNPRTHRRYGFSRLEQMMVTIGTGIRSQEFLLKYYTDGNMPEALCFLPADLGIDRVKEIQNWFDSVMAGDSQKRRRLTFLPGYGTDNGVKPNVIFPKEPLLKAPTDEWIVLIACFAFGMSPQPFLKMMNRATAEVSRESAEAEGLAPDAEAVSDVINQIIDDLGYSEAYEFAWQERRDVDPKSAAETDNLLAGKIYTVNEIREKRGEDPVDIPEANMLGTFSQTGFIPLDADKQAERQNKLQPEASEPNESQPPPTGKQPKAKEKPVPAVSQKKIVARPNGMVQHTGFASGIISETHIYRGSVPEIIKAVRLRFQHGDQTVASKRAELSITKSFKKVFKAQQKKTRQILSEHLEKLTKSKEDDLLAELLRNIEAEFDDVPDSIAADLEASILSGVEQGFLQLDLNDKSLLAKVNTLARDWAEDRAAELIGRKYDEDGNLIENPNAEMAISDTTRDEIQRIVSHAFEEESVSIDDLSNRIQAAGIFSDSRAEMIARTEVNRAQTEGNYKMWEESGSVGAVEWFVSNDEGVCEECEMNNGHIVKIGEAFPSGAEKPGDDHPNCRCILAAAEIK